MSIKARVFWLAGSLLILMVLLCGSMVFLLQKSNSAFATTYQDRVIPLKQLKVVADMFAVNVVDTIHKTNAGTLSAADGSAAIATAEVEFDKQWSAYTATHLTAEETALVAHAKGKINTALGVARQAKQLMQSGQKEALQALANTQLYPAVDPLSTDISKLIDLQLAEAEKNYQSSEQNLQHSMQFASVALLLSLAIGSIMAWRLASRLNSSVRELADTCQAITHKHDLSLRIPVCGKDELAVIAGQLNSLLDNMGTIIQDVRSSSDSINDMARQIGHTSDAISSSSRQQSETTSSIASTVEQFAVSINHIADSADIARQRASQAGTASSDSSRVIDATLQEITAIGAAIRHSEQQVAALTRQSHTIVSVLDVIRDVADQTNLLALNAAIEAARAGDLGRGFAVVADEVRKLAERSAQSTVQIDQMVREITQSAQAANLAMQQSVSRVSKGEALTAEVQEAISRIQQTITEVSTSASEIADALAEQRSASNDMARRVEQIAQLSESNADSAQHLDGYADQLENKADHLENQVKNFTV
jgi:methyl-accepting chemotaxis protein